jgi:5-methylcytosine-specific restriction endonuclease McrA
MDTLQRRYLRNRFGVDSPRYKTYLKDHRASKRLVDVHSRVSEIIHGAEQRGLPMMLHRHDIELLLTGPCHYCGTECPALTSGPGFNGIDRMDNSVRSYTPENSVSCCWTCNKMKGVMGKEEFLAHVARIHRKQSFTAA